MTVSFSRESFLPELLTLRSARAEQQLCEREGGRFWPPLCEGNGLYREALTEKLFHALCLPLVVVAEQIEVRSYDMVARPCKNKWETLIIKEPSLVFI